MCRRFQRLTVSMSSNERGQLRLVEVLGGGVPDRVGDLIGPVGGARQRLGQGQRNSLGLAEVRRLTPGGDGEHALLALAGLARRLGVSVDAHAAAVDLAGAQVHVLAADRDAVVADGREPR
jgi:hypothetical protein